MAEKTPNNIEKSRWRVWRVALDGLVQSDATRDLLVGSEGRDPGADEVQAGERITPGADEEQQHTGGIMVV